MEMLRVPFNKPFLTGQELTYIRTAVEAGKLSGDGMFTHKAHQYFETRFGIGKALLTTSCTDALEMTALLMRIEPGDEVIMPSFTFVSTANAFILRGAKVVFADSTAETPNVDPMDVERLITPRTRAIVVVHYAGVACDMDAFEGIARKHGLFLVEDAAQAFGAYHRHRALGSIGDFGTFSFHETKNVIAGEGGLLAVNNPTFALRAEIVREKGTNRSAFFRGEIDKYGWVDIGSSYLPSEIVAAFLYAQLEQSERIQARRTSLWQRYDDALRPLALQGAFTLPTLPDYATNNAHIYYLLCASQEERTALIGHLRHRGYHAVFHYLPLHNSPYYAKRHDGRALPHAQRYADTLLRLPLYYDLRESDVDGVVAAISTFYAGSPALSEVACKSTAGVRKM